MMMFLINQMLVPNSTYWNFGVGRDKDDVGEDTEGLNKMKNLGETIVWSGAAITPRKETFPAPAA